MASGAVSSRPGSNLGNPVTKMRSLPLHLPIIPHPKASQPDVKNLQIKGISNKSGRDSPPQFMQTRAHTFVSVDQGGKVNLGLDRANLPPLQDKGGVFGCRANRKTSISSLAWPDLGTPVIHNDKGKYRRTIDETPHCDMLELDTAIREKLDTGQHGLRHLFKANDLCGAGNVTREALAMIVSSLVGYVTPADFNKLLKIKGLDNKTAIGFHEFVNSFTESEQANRPQWLAAVQPAVPVDKLLSPRHLEFHLRHNLSKRHLTQVSSAFIHAQLRALAARGNLKVKDLLPESSLESGGIVLRPHLQQLVHSLGFNIAETEFEKLWQKYDVEGAGALKTSRWFQRLGLDTDGNRITPQMPSKAQTNVGQHSQKRPSKEESTIAADAAVEAAESQECTEQVIKSPVKKRRSAVPRLQSLIHQLFYKFEEPYQQLKGGMECFDFLGNCFIARTDFRRVLHEFGFPISTTQLDFFLSRIAVRSVRGQINYPEFLSKFWSKAPSGVVYRIVSNKHHLFNTMASSDWPSGELSVEQLEAKLVHFLHGDFFKMASTFKGLDKYELGLVTQYEFKNAIERALGYPLSDKYLDEMRAIVCPDKDGLMPFQKFLDMFSSAIPGRWNKKEINGCIVPMVPPASNTSAIGRLQDVAKAEAAARKASEDAKLQEMEQKARKRRQQRGEKDGDEGINLDQLNALMHELVRGRFHDVDKAFKAMDRRMTGRFSKHQFAELLQQCNVELKRAEVERLWDSFPLPADGLFTLTAMVRHYAEYAQNHGLPVPHDIPLIQDGEHGLPDAVDPPDPTVQDKITYHGKFTYAYGRVPTVTELEGKMRVKSSKYPLHGEMTSFSQSLASQSERLFDMCGSMDPDNAGWITVSEMKDLLRLLRIPISSQLFVSLSGEFVHNDSINYNAFLQAFGAKKQTKHACSDRSAQRQEKNTQHNLTLSKLGRKVVTAEKSIRRYLKKSDPEGLGVVSMTTLQAILTKCGISVNEEALYEILNKFDPNMEGIVTYEKVVQHLVQLADRSQCDSGDISVRV